MFVNFIVKIKTDCSNFLGKSIGQGKAMTLKINTPFQHSQQIKENPI